MTGRQTVASQASPRPAARIARTVRRFAWLGAIASVVLLGSSFTWVLGRSSQAPAAAVVPPSEAQIVAQEAQLSQRIAADQKQLAALTRTVDSLTGGGTAQAGGGATAQAQAAPNLPAVHGVTGAS